MFKRQPKIQDGAGEGGPAKANKLSQLSWITLVGGTFLVTVLLLGTGGYVIHQSNTNPEFCGTCHIMQDNVQSYLSSSDMDHVHALAEVQCKECHDYPIPKEISAGVKFIFGNYDVDVDGKLLQRKFNDEMCLECHISYEYLANQTDYLEKNPHLSHWDTLKCRDCHISHGQQIDLCSECHENGGQRMTGGVIIPRAENPWADPDATKPDVEEYSDSN